MIGENISHYRTLEKIGEGGMGQVYLTEDTSLERKVALKFFPECMQQDTTAQKHFIREGKSAAALDHPCICKIYEAGEAEGQIFIAMEYVEDENLCEKLRAGRVSLKEALSVPRCPQGKAFTSAHMREKIG